MKIEIHGRVKVLLSRSRKLLTLGHAIHHCTERFYDTTVMNDSADIQKSND
jgi:hypothetical protein